MNSVLKQLRLPSTTVRHPRSLLEYQKFKGNELRTLLLCGYMIFEKFMVGSYYEHLKSLVLIIHLSESRAITETDLKIIEILSRRFTFHFSTLYGTRHHVQVIHSMIHIAETVRDFGPLTSYTTFNFESLLGKIISVK